eukprot:TRINITY_DN5489_c0_g1_i1.p1 TRINITY_DN5489_c0_g1~~TRINITY_DN5489_c0_g1_i1.p1  ORF type:complete len:703 (+),score=158.50 TRINITY_DN5489_c0_g1_i1:19-2127(+)
MSCCCCETEVHGENAPVLYGASARRKCRDVFFALLFVAFWVGMGIVAYLAVQNGDLRRLSKGTDMFGNMCGVDNTNNKMIPKNMRFDHTNRKDLYWPNPLDLDIQLCVSHCPTSFTSLSKLATLLSTGASAGEEYPCYYNYTPTAYSFQHQLCYPTYSSEATMGRCLPQIYNGTSFSSLFDSFFSKSSSPSTGLGLSVNLEKSIAKMRESILQATQAGSSSSSGSQVVDAGSSTSFIEKFFSYLNSMDTFKSVFADIVECWRWMLGLCAISLGFSLVMLVLIRFCIGVIVWGTLFAVFGAFIALTYTIWKIADDARNGVVSTLTYGYQMSKSNADTLTYVSYVLIGIDTLLFCLLVFMRKRIGLAIACIKEANQAIKAIPTILAFPLLSFIIYLAFWVFFTIVTCLLTTASVVPSSQNDWSVEGYSLPTDNTLRYMGLYWLFGVLWTTAFLNGLHEVSIAGTVATWYWADDKEKGFSWLQPLRCMWWGIRYSFGSIAFGSLILAVVQFISEMLSRLEKQLKQAGESQIVQCIIKALKCCLWCFEKIIKFINRNTYIMIGIKGCSFCQGCRESFMLVLNNPLRVATVKLITAFAMMLMKLLVVICTIILSVWVLSKQGLHFWVIPVIIIAIVSYLITTSITGVYTLAVDTIFMSFLLDSEKHEGSHVSERLTTFVSSSIKRKKEKEIQDEKRSLTKANQNVVN